MSFQLIGGDTSNTSAIVNQVNQNIAQLKVQDVTNIFKDDTGTRRVLLGKGKNDFYGLKVSQAGTDVYDGADEDMVFNSDNNILKIVATGTTTLAGVTGPTIGNFSQEETVINTGVASDSGLVFDVFIDMSGSLRRLPYVATSLGAGLAVQAGVIRYTYQVNEEINAGDVDIVITTTIYEIGYDTSDLNLRWYVYQETAN